ncbi:MAG: aminoacetone oxidase family FAD-binding enzyme, partial [Gammaproteobacteria bacterium]
MPESCDVLVVGAGAAGLMCALTAGRRGRRVVVIDHANKAGKKILMSGGGRCNFTNLNSTPANFLSSNPRFCISALKRYSPYDFLELVERHGIEYVEKAAGQLFCADSSKAILNMLLSECTAVNVDLRLQTRIDKLAPLAGGYRIHSSGGVFDAGSVVIASGGLSIPKMGASGFGYDIARQFGLEIIPTRAGLVPFTLPPQLKDHFAALAGVSCDVTVACNNKAFNAPMLFTHRGLSGPAMLQISSYWQPGDV